MEMAVHCLVVEQMVQDRSCLEQRPGKTICVHYINGRNKILIRIIQGFQYTFKTEMLFYSIVVCNSEGAYLSRCHEKMYPLYDFKLVAVIS